MTEAQPLAHAFAGQRRRVAGLLLAAAAAVLVAACGGGDDEGVQGAPAAPEAPANEKQVTVKLDDFAIEPDDLTVGPGTTIVAENVGAVDHNFTIEKGPDASEDSEDLAATSTFGPGERDELVVNLAPGSYATVCTVGNHRQLGMVGAITVE